MRFIKNEMIFHKLFVWSAMRWKIPSENADPGAAARRTVKDAYARYVYIVYSNI